MAAPETGQDARSADRGPDALPATGHRQPAPHPTLEMIDVRMASMYTCRAVRRKA